MNFAKFVLFKPNYKHKAVYINPDMVSAVFCLEDPAITGILLVNGFEYVVAESPKMVVRELGRCAMTGKVFCGKLEDDGK